MSSQRQAMRQEAKGDEQTDLEPMARSLLIAFRPLACLWPDVSLLIAFRLSPLALPPPLDVRSSCA